MMRRYMRLQPSIAVVASHNNSRLLSSAAAAPTTASSLEAVLRRHLQHVKSGNVHAASTEHQGLVSGMYRYVKGIAAARQHMKDLVLSDTELSEYAQHDKLCCVDLMTDRDVERAACRGTLPMIERPMCGHIPFNALKATTDAVRAHVKERYIHRGNSEDIPLLCNIGCEGSGKTVTLLHTTAAAVHMLEGAVRKCTNNDATERVRWRPLGFYVSFAGDAVDSELHKHEDFPILTAIALRMAYSVIEDCCATARVDATPSGEKKASYEEFATEVLTACHYRWDEETFRGIIAALRAVLGWDGPMFIAVDDFKEAYMHQLERINVELRRVCGALLVNDEVLPLNCVGNSRLKIYESYLAVSACSAVDLVAAGRNRDVIIQPMPMFDMQDLDTQFTHDAAGQLPFQCAAHLSDQETYRLSNEHLLFLIHVSLCAGRPRALSDCLEGHAHDAPGVSFFQQWHDQIFWLRRGVAQLPSVPVRARTCLDACRLVVGLGTECIFNDDIISRRFFVLAPDLSEDYVVTQAQPTRALVSPRFLSTIVNTWPKDDEHESVGCHCENLQRTLETTTDLTLALVKAGPELVRDQHDPYCLELIARWYEAIRLAFEDLTFDALCLRFACALADDAATGERFLNGTFSHDSGSNIPWSTNYNCGPMVLVENVASFPSMFYDAYSDSDAAEDSDVKERKSNRSQALLNSIVVPAARRSLVPAQLHKSSYEHLQAALAKGDHFCFQPRNPNNHCEDGVMFLREDTTSRRWTVFLLKNKYWADDTEVSTQEAATGPRHFVDEWRKTAIHMPAVLVDTDGNTHHLQYARILITVDPVEKKKVHGTATSVSEERNLYAEANAAFIHMLKTNTRDEIESKVREWATTALHPQPFEATSGGDGCSSVTVGDPAEPSPSAGRFPPRDAIGRAKMLVSTMQHHHNLSFEAGKEETSQPTPMKHGRVIGEYCVDLETICKWCPTVGVFVGNLARIRQLMSTDCERHDRHGW
ncbi:multi-copy leucine-rich repeat protein, putative [Bodo saltans]|uniref:Multi-copy leucine-rich repeat protein, putative n=1 Tax=Bodo saltans TaxID=75058 RepID=A0A0S4KQC4_BODSA|nr:multi-copy leucine-rich repeat protein, putative [Bodo saltans]|eukprot:CUI15132.1 multi-copy leucine-rich repeat protein, putative [Bodo saltans]